MDIAISIFQMKKTYISKTGGYSPKVTQRFGTLTSLVTVSVLFLLSDTVLWLKGTHTERDLLWVWSSLPRRYVLWPSPFVNQFSFSLIDAPKSSSCTSLHSTYIYVILSISPLFIWFFERLSHLLDYEVHARSVTDFARHTIGVHWMNEWATTSSLHSL